MAKREAGHTEPTRRAGTTPLHGRPLDDNGAIELTSGPTFVDASEDEQLATTTGTAVQAFLRGLSGFFTTARSLEQQARRTLVTAKVLTAPTSGAEDLQVQQFIRRTTAEKKAVEAHWAITSKVHAFHKALVAARTRATGALDEANEIGNSWHNSYVREERRRAAEAQEQLRREAEAKAEQDRAAELGRLEAAALALEAGMEALSEREQAFVELMTAPGTSYRGDGVRCAKLAGYQDPSKAAARLLGTRKVKEAIQGRLEALALRETAAAAAREPVYVEDVPTIAPDIEGKGDRSTHTGEILDAGKFIQAVLSGGHGIPTDVLMIDQKMLNEYARSLHERLDRWPGVRYKKTTRVV